MSRNDSKKIVQSPHSLCEFGRCQYPSATQAAQAVYLGQTAGDDKLLSQMERSPGRKVERGIKINLINQDSGAGLMRNLSYLTESGLGGECAARIVEIRNYNQGRRLAYATLDLFRVQAESVFKPAFKSSNPRSQIQGGRNKELIGRRFDQDLIARLN